MSLTEVAVGSTGTIVRVNELDVAGERLMEMGLVPGTPLQVLRRGWRGQVMQLLVRGTVLSLRREQANTIDIEFTPQAT